MMADHGTPMKRAGQRPSGMSFGCATTGQTADAEYQGKAENAGDGLPGFAHQQIVMEIEQPQFGPFPEAGPALDQSPVLREIGAAAVGIAAWCNPISSLANVIRDSSGPASSAAATERPSMAGSLTTGSSAPVSRIQLSSHSSTVPDRPRMASSSPTSPPVQRCSHESSAIRIHRAMPA